MEHKVSDISLQFERERETLIDAGGQSLLPIVRLIANDGELWQFGIFHAAHWSGFPVHDHIADGIAIWGREYLQYLEVYHALSMLFHILTTLYFYGAILGIQWIVMQVHHAGQCGGEPHAIRNGAIAAQTHQLISLSDIVQKAWEK